jgi:hypothetical protein
MPNTSRIHPRDDERGKPGFHNRRSRLKIRARGGARHVGCTENVTKGMSWEATWEICVRRTRVRVRIEGGRGSRQHALSGRVCPSLNHRPACPSARLTPAPGRGTTRGWRTFIPDVGRCQLTRSAPRSRGTEGVWGMIFVLGTIPSIIARRRVRALPSPVSPPLWHAKKRPLART